MVPQRKAWLSSLASANVRVRPGAHIENCRKRVRVEIGASGNESIEAGENQIELALEYRQRIGDLIGWDTLIGADSDLDLLKIGFPPESSDVLRSRHVEAIHDLAIPPCGIACRHGAAEGRRIA